MSVNKYKIRLIDLETNNRLKIPLSLEYNSVDQAEIVNREFISVETKNAINPIIDYEKVRFSPKLSNGDLIKDLNINLKFLINGSYPSNTFYSDIGFNDDDIKFQKNSFKNSFLRLSFYDSDAPTNQNLISFITIYSKITFNDINPFTDGEGIIRLDGGLPKNANELIVKYTLKNPIINPEAFAEGFYLYHYKSNVDFLAPSQLFMRAEFNNASTGKRTKFITTNELLDINSVIKKLHVRYLLTRDSTGYYYAIDKNYNNATNIIEGTTKLDINLYEIRVD